MFDVSNFILGRRAVKIGDYATGVEIDMPFGTLLVMGFGEHARPAAFLPKGRAKARVDGVQHHVKYGTQRGYGVMWLRQKGRTAKRHQIEIECAAALVGYAALDSYGEAFEAARKNGTFDTLRQTWTTSTRL
jgi:hypothetical protein